MMRRASAGFSLLELLVAFVILALTLSVMMRIFSGGLRNVDLAEDYSHAILLAESKLAELGVQPTEGETSGELNGKYRWHGHIRPWIDNAYTLEMGAQPLPVRLMEIDVTVAWGGGDGTRSREVSLRTLQLAPGP